jgi:hypothetical protein
VIDLFDADRNGALDDRELRLDSDAKVALIAKNLAALGVESPKIQAELKPYAIHHGIARGAWAGRECGACHDDKTRFPVAAYVPGGVMPEAISGGDISRAADGSLIFIPRSGK